MGLLSKKKKEEKISDRDKLMSLMQQAIDTMNFNDIDTSVLEDKELASKFSEMLNKVVLTNNQTVMRLNNSMRKIGDSSVVKDMIEQVNAQTTEIELMKDNSSTLGTSIETIMKLIQGIQDNANVVAKTSSDSSKELENSISLIDESSSMVDDMNEKIDNFKSKAAMINDIIIDIKKVASKSGMLALNASIEAARAGEAGKGFAVVASQVRDLSTNTTESAENIQVYMDELLGELDELSISAKTTTEKMKEGTDNVHHSIESISSLDASIDSIKKEIDTIYDEINTQSALTEAFIATTDSMANSYNTLSNECINTGTHLYKISRDIDKTRSDLARGNSKLNPLDWITVYEIDHLIFTWRIYNNVAGFEKLLIEQVNNNKGCKFGKWLGANANEPIGKTAEYRNALNLHDNLHKYAVASWTAMNEGNREEAVVQFEHAYSEYLALTKAFDGLRKALRALGEREETKL